MPVMKNLLLPISLSILFLGCSQSALSVFGEKGVYKKGVEDTKIRYVVHKNETIALLNATLLNNSHPDNYDNDFNNFLIGLYTVDDRVIDLEYTRKYQLRLNGKEIYKYQLISKESEQYKSIPVKNPYATYYIISFKKQNSETTLNLEYKYSTYNKVSLPFVIK